ncbi:GNAT family N-acetyltransferase [bacterium]|nr:GNAT family N-acetyltransferase [Candidatus Omnitrophota bacterium]MBU2527934.1 GNAT family N-acetyltransferase [bacterium]MBU3929288.1 GNAT family N-acetyltransferase [bacterium]MBU4123826.1 GNAT family N-acetyltransferase [bacterium]
MKYKILRAEIKDAEEILKLQKLSYQSEAERYNNYDIQPLKQTTREVQEQFEGHVFLKAICEGEIIGTVRAHENNGVCYIGKLAVHPNMQNKGIGSALMNEIEKCYTPEKFDLFVGSKSDKNILLYQKLGYSIYKIEKYGCGDIRVFYMEKNA